MDWIYFVENIRSRSRNIGVICLSLLRSSTLFQCHNYSTCSKHFLLQRPLPVQWSYSVVSMTIAKQSSGTVQIYQAMAYPRNGSASRAVALDLMLRTFMNSADFHTSNPKIWDNIAKLVPGTTPQQVMMQCQVSYAS